MNVAPGGVVSADLEHREIEGPEPRTDLGMLGRRTDDGWERFFPNAPVLVSAREAEAILDAGEYQPSGSEMFRALH